MSKTKKLFKIKLLIGAYTLALVVGVMAPPGHPTITPAPQPVFAATPTSISPPTKKPAFDEPATPYAQTLALQQKYNPTKSKKLPIVKNGRVNYPYYALKNASDPLSASAWNHTSAGVRSAWDITTGLPQPIIAVIDTGFAFNHEDLASQWWQNLAELGSTTTEGPTPNCTSRGLPLDKSCDNIDNDSNGYVDDWRGWDFENYDNDATTGTTSPSSSSASHGTSVAGIIGAAGNTIGVAGINWNARIMPLQALSDDGSGYTDAVADAIRYAANNGAKIINLSLGSEYTDTYLQAAIIYAINKGVVIVAAAGNDGCDCILYPANYPEVIAVGATNSSDIKASFSSYGANLDLTAPGTSGVCTTSWSQSNQTNAYSCSAQGTSFASPHVAGAISLLLARRPGLSPQQVEEYLRNSSNRVSAMSGAIFTTAYGYGRLNIYRLITAATIPQSVGDTATTSSATTTLSSPQNLSTLCQSTSTSCDIELTDSTGNTIKVSSAIVSQWHNNDFSTTPQSLGVSAGTWVVRSIDPTTGRSIDPGTELLIN